MNGFPGDLVLRTPGTTNGLAFQSVTIELTDAAILQEIYSKNTLAVWFEVRTTLSQSKNNTYLQRQDS